MTLPACASLHLDSSVYFVSLNATYAHYSCRGGYRYLTGDHYRSCDSNGTWTGQALQCVVDSVMPKTYLVILIVGATVAIFVACIPYDFYRFRKRKKKVRDHQERLSLVTRIAPSHATVILDTDTNAAKPAPDPPRKFGFKSLFSVFKFVGAKMKTAGEEDSNKSVSKSDNGKVKSIGEEGSSSDGAGVSGSGVSGSGVSGNGNSAASGSGICSGSGSSTLGVCGGSGSGSGSGKINESGSGCSSSGGGGGGGGGNSSGSGSGGRLWGAAVGSMTEKTHHSHSHSPIDGGYVDIVGMPSTSSFLLDTHHSNSCGKTNTAAGGHNIANDVIDLCGDPRSSSYAFVNRASVSISPDDAEDDLNRQLFEKGTGTVSSGNSVCSFPGSARSNSGHGGDGCYGRSLRRSVSPPSSSRHDATSASASASSSHSIDSAAFRNAVVFKKSSSTSLASRKFYKLMTKSVSDTRISPDRPTTTAKTTHHADQQQVLSYSNPATVEVTPISSPTTTNSPTFGSSSKIINNGDATSNNSYFPVYIPPPPPSSSSSHVIRAASSSSASSTIASSSSPNLYNNDGSRTFHSQTSGMGGDSYHSMPTIVDAP